MLSAARAFSLNSRSAPLLPKVSELAPLYDGGVSPRQGDLIMVAGRSGSQKSGFALFWTRRMNLSTLYFSGDMTAFEATSRLAAMDAEETTEEIEANLARGQAWQYEAILRDNPIHFSFGQPITWPAIEANLDAWIETYNKWPEVIVIDNLMDMAGGESDYAAQQQAMQDLTSLSRATGSTVLVLHHASEKHEGDQSLPPNRKSIKNGLTEKPQLILGVAFVDHPVVGGEFRVATLKQRSGPADPSGLTFTRLKAEPQYTRFMPRERTDYGF